MASDPAGRLPESIEQQITEWRRGLLSEYEGVHPERLRDLARNAYALGLAAGRQETQGAADVATAAERARCLKAVRFEICSPSRCGHECCRTARAIAKALEREP